MIFITGDTHRDIDIKKLNTSNFTEGKNLTKQDYVIICGDFGGVWHGGKKDDWWLNWLNSKPWTTLFCDGNHENFNLLEAYPEEEQFGGKVHVIKDSIFHLMRGQVFEIDGCSFFVMGGAASVDKQYRKENISWWKQEIPTKEEFERGFISLDAVNWNVDYVISHTGPYSIIKTIKYIEQDDVSRYLDIIKDNLTYKTWYFGHMHYDGIINDFVLLYNKINKI